MDPDYLINEEYRELIDELEVIPIDFQRSLIRNYIWRTNDIDYIYYTGEGSKFSGKHTLDEFMRIAYPCAYEYGVIPAWPILVVIMGAAVYWKNRE